MVERVRKAVKQYENGNLVAIYESRTSASDATGVDVASIRKVCRGDRNMAGGFVWKNSNLSLAVKHTKNTSGMVVQYDANGKCKGIYSSHILAGKATGIRPDNIKSVLKGTRNTAGGYSWVKGKED